MKVGQEFRANEHRFNNDQQQCLRGQHVQTAGHDWWIEPQSHLLALITHFCSRKKGGDLPKNKVETVVLTSG
jgi:hypothetical protein